MPDKKQINVGISELADPINITANYMKNGIKNMIYANFDPINSLVSRQTHVIS